MNSSVLRIYVVILFVLFSTQLALSAEDESPPSNFITWEDLRVNFTNLSNGEKHNTVIVVAKDGTGDSRTIQGAVNMVPDHNTKRVKIVILPGIYRERVHIPSHKPYVSFIGIQPSQTVITFNAKASDKDANGNQLNTGRTATVEVESDYFCATGITFQNTVVAESKGKGMQAVALKITGDKAVFFNANFLGGQDTLYDSEGSHYFYRCFIEGRVDFIFGKARSLYEGKYIWEELGVHIQEQSTFTVVWTISSNQKDGMTLDTQKEERRFGSGNTAVEVEDPIHQDGYRGQSYSPMRKQGLFWIKII
ncbi:Pectinesterase [Macleaya cordata]|uniref:pectinesterase n=1 Tax=Macleaya cordata TaxID=56857 RepID=A0A200QNF4_MACCD|nr:Pectinesterase [Macleaya cordata]